VEKQNHDERPDLRGAARRAWEAKRAREKSGAAPPAPEKNPAPEPPESAVAQRRRKTPAQVKLEI